MPSIGRSTSCGAAGEVLVVAIDRRQVDRLRQGIGAAGDGEGVEAQGGEVAAARLHGIGPDDVELERTRFGTPVRVKRPLRRWSAWIGGDGAGHRDGGVAQRRLLLSTTMPVKVVAAASPPTSAVTREHRRIAAPPVRRALICSTVSDRHRSGRVAGGGAAVGVGGDVARGGAVEAAGAAVAGERHRGAPATGLPALSRARTTNGCGPCRRPGRAGGRPTGCGAAPGRRGRRSRRSPPLPTASGESALTRCRPTPARVPSA